MPETTLHMKIDTRSVDETLKKVKGRTKDPKIPFTRIHREMQVRVSGPAGIFEQLRHGGTYRGVMWKYFSPQYTRKTDGITVPAWGGVPKIRGNGLVKGRKRPSGARVKQGDAIMQDTGNLRARALSSVRITRFRLVMGNNLTYGAAQDRKS